MIVPFPSGFWDTVWTTPKWKGRTASWRECQGWFVSMRR